MGAADVGVVTLEACQHRDGRRENDGVVRGRWLAGDEDDGGG